jgi:hypothetical protein
MDSRTLRFLTVAIALIPISALGAPEYRMSLDVDPLQGAFRGDLQVTYRNETSDEQAELFFRLYGNADAIYGSAAIQVTSVSLGDAAVDFALYSEDTILYAPLPAPLAPGDSISITLQFRGSVSQAGGSGFASQTEYGLLTRAGDTLTLTAFYPLLAPITSEGWAIDPVAALGDALFAAAANYDVSLLVPEGFTVIPTPDASQTTPDGRRACTFARAGLRDFTLVLVEGERVPTSASASGTTVRSWFAPHHAAAAAAALDRSVAAIELYSELFGALPYPTVDVVEAPLQRVAGVECSALFLVSSSYADDPRNPFFDIIVSHEMAHQWFYAAVGNDPAEDPWLDESLATYASNVFLAAAVSDDAARAARAEWRASFDRAAAAHPALSVTSAVYAFPDSGTYSAFVYAGGALELDALRQDLGDEAFFAALSNYYETHLGSIAGEADLLESLRSACGCWFASPLWDGSTAPSS